MSKELTENGETKVKPGLVYYSLITELSKVRMYGIKKYGHKDDWKDTKNTREEFMNAALRHMHKASEAEQGNGNMHDTESCLLHLSHAATNIMFLLEEMQPHFKNEQPEPPRAS